LVTRCDKSTLLSLIHPGDLVEFYRAGPPPYCHWGVFVGPYEYGGVPRPCLVHRANPRDTSLGLSSSDSLRKGELGIVDVAMEPLPDVWSDSRARINNTTDNSLEPLPISSGIMITH
jgi:hypothetical protein